MKTEWIKHRRVIAAYYRSANEYAALCRIQNLSSAHLNPIEVQIIEQIIENSEENNNMKWYAQQIGISSSAFTNYVNVLVKKGLVEKYHTSDNRKNIIIKLTDAGLRAYEEYAASIAPMFTEIFEILDSMDGENIEKVIKLLNAWGDSQAAGTEKGREFVLIPIEK